MGNELNLDIGRGVGRALFDFPFLNVERPRGAWTDQSDSHSIGSYPSHSPEARSIVSRQISINEARSLLILAPSVPRGPSVALIVGGPFSQ